MVAFKDALLTGSRYDPHLVTNGHLLMMGISHTWQSGDYRHGQRDSRDGAHGPYGSIVLCTFGENGGQVKY
jgi:hypothetical protein